MAIEISDDLAQKAAAMLEFRKYRDAGLPVPPEVRARHVAATNDNYATGPALGQKIPDFSLADQYGAIRTLKDLAGPAGLFLIFHRSAEWCQYCRSQLVELELSRPLFEANGVGIAAVSYDSQEVLRAFSGKHSIGYPLLSDRGSETIRKFGIFNQNMAPHLRAYGVPHPVEYLVTPDGTVAAKYFVPNYMHRVTGSSVMLREFNAIGEDGPSVLLRDGALSARIGFPTRRAFSGQELAFVARFAIESGWHVYAASESTEYAGLEVRFEDANVLRQSFTLPSAEQMQAPTLGETVRVYRGAFQGIGSLLLKHPLPEGELILAGRLQAQQCGDTTCEPPRTMPFELRLELQPFMISDRERMLEQKTSA
jgi:peroxiredoxin